MPVVTLTELTLRNLKKPDKGYVIYADRTLSGFGVRVTERGHGSYVLTYGPKRKRITIGDVGVVKLGQAREKAKTFLSEFQLHGEKPKALTWEEARALYEALHLDIHNRESSAKETKRLLKRFDRLKGKHLSDIAPGDLLPIIDKLVDTPSSANHHFTAVKGFLNWCVGRQYLTYNPLQGARKPAKTSSRDRVLSDEELKAILATAPLQGKYGEIVLWCLHTLQRRGQFALLRAEFIDSDNQTITWPPECMKGGRTHEIPYCALYSNIPEEGLVFANERGNPWNAWSKPHKAVLKASGTSGWNLHDLRRTGATRLAEMGVAPHVIERLLAHASGTLTPLALIYNRATYLKEMREALAGWEEYLHNLASS